MKLRAFSEVQGQLIFYRRADESGPKESFYIISNTSEPASLRQALDLAYGATGRVKKRRMLYFVGRTRIHLDQVEDLGSFLELEVVLEENESSEKGTAEAKDILRRLGVEESQLVQGAYVDLLRENTL